MVQKFYRSETFDYRIFYFYFSLVLQEFFLILTIPVFYPSIAVIVIYHSCLYINYKQFLPYLLIISFLYDLVSLSPFGYHGCVFSLIFYMLMSQKRFLQVDSFLQRWIIFTFTLSIYYLLLGAINYLTYQIIFSDTRHALLGSIVVFAFYPLFSYQLLSYEKRKL